MKNVRFFAALLAVVISAMIFRSALYYYITNVVILRSIEYTAEDDHSGEQPAANGEIARMADSFVESLGTQLYLDNVSPYLCSDHQDVTIDGLKYDWCFINIIVPRLQELGVRYYRESLMPSKKMYDDHGWAWIDKSQGGSDSYEWKLREMRYLNSKLGMKCICYVSTNVKNSIDLPQVERVVSQLKVDKNMIAAYHGPNEYNNKSLYNVPADWLDRITTYTQSIHDAFKADGELNTLPIIGPSFVYEDDQSAIAARHLERWVDYGATNFYTAYWDFKNRETTPADFLPLGTAPYLLDRHIHYFSEIPYPGKSLYVTETGYLQSTPPATKYFITEAVAAKYQSRRHFEMFNRDIKLASVYFFADTTNNQSDERGPIKYGLLSSAGTPKPAFNTFKNLITLFKDPGTSFTPGKLDYKLDAGSSVQHTLLQKRDGTFYLVLWNDVVATDTTTQATLSFTADMDAKIYHPVKSVEVAETLSGAALKINVPDEPIILKLSTAQGNNNGSGGGSSSSGGSGGGSSSKAGNQGGSTTNNNQTTQSSTTPPPTAAEKAATATTKNEVTLPSALEKFFPGLQVQGVRAKLYVGGTLIILLGLAFMWTFRRVLRRRLQAWRDDRHQNSA